MENKRQKHKILVMEDDLAMRDIVTRKLIASGFDVMAAGDGRAGLDLFEKESPQLVLLDLMMPEMDGFAVLENIRKSDEAAKKHTPVIVLSNLWSNKDIMRVQTLHADAYMVKAYYTTEEILNKVKEYIS